MAGPGRHWRALSTRGGETPGLPYPVGAPGTEEAAVAHALVHLAGAVRSGWTGQRVMVIGPGGTRHLRAEPPPGPGGGPWRIVEADGTDSPARAVLIDDTRTVLADPGAADTAARRHTRRETADA